MYPYSTRNLSHCLPFPSCLFSVAYVNCRIISVTQSTVTAHPTSSVEPRRDMGSSPTTTPYLAPQKKLWPCYYVLLPLTSQSHKIWCFVFFFFNAKKKSAQLLVFIHWVKGRSIFLRFDVYSAPVASHATDHSAAKSLLVVPQETKSPCYFRRRTKRTPWIDCEKRCSYLRWGTEVVLRLDKKNTHLAGNLLFYRKAPPPSSSSSSLPLIVG